MAGSVTSTWSIKLVAKIRAQRREPSTTHKREQMRDSAYRTWKKYLQVCWGEKNNQQLFSVPMTNTNRFKLHQESSSLNTEEGKQCNIVALVPTNRSSSPHQGQTCSKGAAHALGKECALESSWTPPALVLSPGNTNTQIQETPQTALSDICETHWQNCGIYMELSIHPHWLDQEQTGD